MARGQKRWWAAPPAAFWRRPRALAVAASVAVACRAHIEPTSPTPAPPPNAGSPALTNATANATPYATANGRAPSLDASNGATPSAALGARGPSHCANGSESALAELGCELAFGIGPLAGGGAVAVSAVASERTAPRGANLSTRIAVSLTKALGGRLRPLTGAPALAQARALAGSAGSLVFVAPEVSRGRLRLSAAVYALAPNQWRNDVAPAPRARVEAARPLDGELGAFLSPISIAVTRVEHAAAADVVALACGDVTGNGDTELVAVGRRKVRVGKLGDGRFSVRTETDWATLSPIAASPLREPIGAAQLIAGSVFVGSTDRAYGLELSPALAPLERLEAPLPWAGVGCLSRTGVALGALGACRRGAAPAAFAGSVDGVDAFAGGTAVDRSGKVVRTAAFRDAKTREVTLRDDTGRTANVPLAGSALAIADLDLDGAPELVTSLDTDDPKEDAIVVSTWTREGAIVERLRIPMPEGVHAIAACPVEDVRMAPLVAATGGGLWLAR